MAIYVSTCQPRKLLEDIKQAINDKKTKVSQVKIHKRDLT